uniref:EF-hand domain-containing protein n=1 Tax=Mesocestoides corti TaxID=53468 RepID=A0A5K3ETB1_MESCO
MISANSMAARGALICLFIISCTNCAPVHPKAPPKTKQAKMVSEEFRDYLEKLFKAMENSTEFIEHVSNLHQEPHNVNISLLSHEVREKLNQIKFETRNYFVDLLASKRNSGKDTSVQIPSDLAKALDIGNTTNFSAIDIEEIMKMLRDRQNAIDREEVLLLNEIEVMKVLERWESHLNDSAAERQKAQAEFEAEKKLHSKSGKFHEPGSRAQEREQWQKGDNLPDSDFNPRIFFLMHDLNSDGVWDSEEVEAMLSAEVDQVDEDSPEKQQEYLLEMRQKVFELIDKDHDGVISYEEHMNHINSPEGMDDDGWLVGFEPRSLMLEATGIRLKVL